MTEREERLALEISVCMSRHVVIAEIRKVRIRCVECHRKSSGRIVVAEKHISHSLTTGLTCIPALKDCITCLGLWSHCYSRTRKMHEDYRLSCLLELLDICSLSLRKLDRSPVATLETLEVHSHLLALELWRKTSDKDDRVDVVKHGKICDRSSFGS